MKRNAGFSLFEIAIVVIVVALIAAAVVSTRSMVQTSQLQAVVSERQMVAMAVRNFGSKNYGQKPGDANDIASFGAIEASEDCEVTTSHPTGKQTCKGNGDGVIEAARKENFLAFRHLALAGFLVQNFTGALVTGACNNTDLHPGVNVPQSKFGDAAWNLTTAIPGTLYTGGAGDQFIQMNVCSNNLQLLIATVGGAYQKDAAQPNGCALSQEPKFTGAQALAIDKKLDNGKTTGNIRPMSNNTSSFLSCTDEGNVAGGGYRIDSTEPVCSLAFILTM